MTIQNSGIFIQDCRVNLRIGIDPDEQDAPQAVLISVKANYAPDSFFPDINERSRDRIIDYSRIHAFISRDLPAMGHIGLLEAAAEQIIAFCFRDGKIQAATVRIEKTTIFKDATGAGVEVSRSRKEQV